MKQTLLIAGCLLFLASCAPQSKTLYSWSNYNEVAYKYIKNNTDTDEAALMKTLQEMIEKPTGERQVPPPGICADYGYMLVKQGKKSEGIAMLKKEIALYPESAVFVGRIIKQLED